MDAKKIGKEDMRIITEVLGYKPDHDRSFKEADYYQKTFDGPAGSVTEFMLRPTTEREETMHGSKYTAKAWMNIQPTKSEDSKYSGSSGELEALGRKVSKTRFGDSVLDLDADMQTAVLEWEQCWSELYGPNEDGKDNWEW